MQCEKALEELHWYVKNCNLVCLIPIYEDYITHNPIYDINKMLAYFRRQLIKEEIPTILCNNCSAGFIYRMLGVQRISPTINNIILSDDYMRLCREPEKYLQQDMETAYWGVWRGEKCPIGRINDIEVYFVHDTNQKEALDRWNRLRKRVNYDHLVYLFVDIGFNGNGCLFYSDVRKFCSMKQRHLCILNKNMYIGSELKGAIYMNHGHFHTRDAVIENYFDIMGWINREYEI